MISAEYLPLALRALQRFIVHAKARAYDAGDVRVAELLNDLELLPEFIADEQDRTAEFLEMLESMSTVRPECRYIVAECTPAATPIG